VSESAAGAEEPTPPTGAYLGLVVLENQRLQRGASLSPSPSANDLGIERNINYPTPLRGRRFAGKNSPLDDPVVSCESDIGEVLPRRCG